MRLWYGITDGTTEIVLPHLKHPTSFCVHSALRGADLPDGAYCLACCRMTWPDSYCYTSRVRKTNTFLGLLL